MAVSNYKQVLIPFLDKLSLQHSGISEVPERIGLCFDSDIFVNIELLPHSRNEQIVLTGKVGAVAEFGAFYDVCALVAKGNFYLAKSNSCTLSVHEETQIIYVQYVLLAVSGEIRMVEMAALLLENALVNIVECIRHIRSEGLH